MTSTFINKIPISIDIENLKAIWYIYNIIIAFPNSNMIRQSQLDTVWTLLYEFLLLFFVIEYNWK